MKQWSWDMISREVLLLSPDAKMAAHSKMADDFMISDDFFAWFHRN